MYKKILVPLDGSELAECVIPHVETIAGASGVKEVTFIRVVEPAVLPTGVLTDGAAVFTEANAEQLRRQIDERNEADSREYLDKIKDRVKIAGVDVKVVTLKGKPADEIADYAEKSEADLIIIASHGRSGISRWMHGSVADRLLRTVCIPVMMIRAPGCVTGV